MNFESNLHQQRPATAFVFSDASVRLNGRDKHKRYLIAEDYCDWNRVCFQVSVWYTTICFCHQWYNRKLWRQGESQKKKKSVWTKGRGTTDGMRKMSSSVMAHTNWHHFLAKPFIRLATVVRGWLPPTVHVTIMCHTLWRAMHWKRRWTNGVSPLHWGKKSTQPFYSQQDYLREICANCVIETSSSLSSRWRECNRSRTVESGYWFTEEKSMMRSANHKEKLRAYNNKCMRLMTASSTTEISDSPWAGDNDSSWGLFVLHFLAFDLI